ncbi:MAG TPA: GTPase Era [Gammaproteobacteria bacterium]|jgi:GTP-binding protein Era|nr:GTPase Era [Gammaproteobacteria bacterium]
MTIKKAGYAVITGRPNVGKSTLMNALLGEKVSITSPKPQTTRWQIAGIHGVGDTQIVFIDTPGVNDNKERAMNRYLNRMATAVYDQADVIVFVVDAKQWREEDAMVLAHIKNVNKPVILALNKIDLLDNKSELLPIITKMNDKYPFAAIVPMSAQGKDNLNVLETEIAKFMPEGEAIYPEDQLTDKSVRFLVAEIIREKLIYATEDELPYTTSVQIEEFKASEALTEINALIWVEREGQRAIVIGKGGEKLKKIGTQARKEIERLIGSKVFLRLWVKVKADWTDDEAALRSLGLE